MASTTSSNGVHYTSTATHTTSVWIRTGLETVFKLQAHSNYASASAAGSAETLDFQFTLTGDGTVTSIESGGIAASVTKYPNNWYRCTLTYHRNSTSNVQSAYGVIVYPVNYASYNTNSVSGDIFWLWGPQVETGAFPTSFIPNANDGTFATRGADIVDIDGEDFTDFYNQSEGTLLSSHTLLPNVPNAENVYVYQIQDASTNNTIRVIDKNSSYSNVATAIVLNGGSSQAHFNNTTDSFGKDKVLVALSVKNNDFAGCHNGGTVETDTSGTLPTNFNSLGIGRYPPSGGYELNGHIQRFIYYPKQLSDSQLKTLTS